jgi:hypothetical protein
MSELEPRGEKMRRAVRWVSAQREERPEARLAKLVDEAVLRFDLSPREAELLLAFYRGAGARPPSAE